MKWCLTSSIATATTTHRAPDRQHGAADDAGRERLRCASISFRSAWAVSRRSCGRPLISYDPSMEARDLAIGLAGGRIAIGVLSLFVPGLVGRAMTGRDGAIGGTRLFARMV